MLSLVLSIKKQKKTGTIPWA